MKVKIRSLISFLIYWHCEIVTACKRNSVHKFDWWHGKSIARQMRQIMMKILVKFTFLIIYLKTILLVERSDKLWNRFPIPLVPHHIQCCLPCRPMRFHFLHDHARHLLQGGKRCDQKSTGILRDFCRHFSVVCLAWHFRLVYTRRPLSVVALLRVSELWDYGDCTDKDMDFGL